MEQIEFSVPARCDVRKAEALIERVCAAHGLQAAMKGKLSSYPGSIHWHYKKRAEKGTLELTLLPRERPHLGGDSHQSPSALDRRGLAQSSGGHRAGVAGRCRSLLTAFTMES